MFFPRNSFVSFSYSARLEVDAQHLKAAMEERRRVVDLLKSLVQPHADSVSRAVDAAAEAVENASRAVQSLVAHIQSQSVGAAGAGGQTLVAGMPDSTLI